MFSNVDQARVREVLDQLSVGQLVVIPGRGGWELVVTRCESGFDFTHRNPAGDGENDKFFAYDTTGNPYGAGKIRQEPSLGVQCRNCGVDVDGTIVGAIVLDVDGKVTARFSWSNIVFLKKQRFSINTQGELVVNGASQGFLHTVFMPDKNRMDGYVGVFKPNPPTNSVKVLEMETLLLNSI